MALWFALVLMGGAVSPLVLAGGASRCGGIVRREFAEGAIPAHSGLGYLAAPSSVVRSGFGDERKNKSRGERVSVQLHIPDSVACAIRLPEERMPQELLEELAIALYGQGILSLGKAREMAGMGKYEFGQLLGKRGIPRHYGREEFEDDLKYARGE